ncbi:MAG: 3-hydroxyacyl-CoA dehydrogenase NAD-binding domain-containing protein, partial [Pseudomonadota bacterium]
MEEVVSYQAREGVAVLRISNPPVNALSQPVRAALLAALARANADDAVTAILLTGAGATFPAGADIREFDSPSEAPHLPEVCNAIEASPKAVVACLHGTALGGGYEIALAAHARLAAPGTRVGLPEVGLGILPGAGGTQRLPRIAAIEDALSLLLSGRPVPLAQDATQGLVDGLVEGDFIAGGIVHARALADAPPPPTRTRRTRFADAFAYQQAVDSARKREGPGASRATRAILDCVEAAPLLPFDQGLALERDHFLELRDTAEAQALRHAFVAVREAAKPREGLPEPSTIASVAIVGGGRMGSGITIACLDAGLEVVLIDRPGEVDAAEGRVTGIYRRAVRRGRMAQTTQDGRLSRLSVSSELGQASGADLILEAAPEDQVLKASLLSELAKIAKPEAILATNTSYLDIDELAQASTRPDRFIGLHFFAPAHIQQAVEVVVGEATSPETEASAFAFASGIRKKPVFSENAPGFIANRILGAYRRAAD